MTQTELATAIGVSQEAVCQWEAKKTRPSYENLLLIAKALDCTLDDVARED